MSDTLTTGTTSVPAPSLTDAGFVSPAETDILSGALADINAAFGNNLNTALSTPQGQLAMTLTAILGDAYDQMLAVFNGVDPARASGRMQDAIGDIYFLERLPATSTVVSVACSGAANAVIPHGTLVQDGNGNTYAAANDITLDAKGAGAGDFACTVTGPIACPANTIEIYQSVVGLSSVSNAADGIIGSDVEGRRHFEVRRRASVAKNATGSVSAIRGAVLSVAGVNDAYACDNPNDTPITVDGVTISPHSVYVCVDGGSDAGVAAAIRQKKPAGCGYTGTTAVVDNNAADGAQTVLFSRAQKAPVFLSVVLVKSASTPNNFSSLVQDAIIDAFYGESSEYELKIDSMLYASQFYDIVQGIGSWAKLLSITMGLSPEPSGLFISVGADSIPEILPENITVSVV